MSQSQNTFLPVLQYNIAIT